MRKYRKLEVWNLGITLVKEVYRLTKAFPENEKFGLVSQLRRSAVSIPSNIAEGFGRNSDKEFYRFLSIARGSLYEVETQLEIVHQVGLSNNIVQYDELLEKLHAKLNSLMNAVKASDV